MTRDVSALATLADADLLAEVNGLTSHERQATALLIASLAELDARRLYLMEGCSSLFTYCIMRRRQRRWSARRRAA
jgi:hypothetical protein